MRRHTFTLIFIFIILLFTFPAAAATNGGKDADHLPGRAFEIVDEKEELVTVTARKVSVGDEIITAAGKHYRVISVNGLKAGAKLLGRDNEYLAWVNYFDNPVATVSVSHWRERPIGVYHTHSDESYVPTDGRPSIPFRGGIYQVGTEFVKTLRDNGAEVKYYKTPHDPHDDNAYARSRRTAMGILKNNPVAVFDVHRDGVRNPKHFRETVSGETIAQLRLVVGRQNPKMAANMDFARRLMAGANKRHPGLVKEIYKAHGNYNQDLLSTAILLEAGTYTNNRAMAENGIKFLAEAVPAVLGVNNPGGGITGKEAGRTGWSVAVILTLVTIGAGLVFTLINFGWQGTLSRAGQLFSRLNGNGIRERLSRAGERAREYVRGPLAEELQALRERLKEILGSRNRI